jgi:hypothetical protein
MFKPFSLLFFVAVFVWVVRIFLTTDGSERIVRTCQPIDILGNVSISTTALLADGLTQPITNVMNSWVYGCRYIVWRSIYEDDYLKYTQAQQTTDGAQDATQTQAEPAKPEKPAHHGKHREAGG